MPTHAEPTSSDYTLLAAVARLAEHRLAHGVRLSFPQAVAYLSMALLSGARAGCGVDELMHSCSTLLTRDDVLDGVADMIHAVEVHLQAPAGPRVVAIPYPIV